VHRVDDMAGAVLLLQGLDDPVVPPDQSAAMADALRARGLRCDYLTFEGEGHGFRKSDTIRAALQAELAFLLDVLRLR
jgi:dipeptidyl aminopeptidase/acylaminoacyl peptidase